MHGITKKGDHFFAKEQNITCLLHIPTSGAKFAVWRSAGSIHFIVACLSVCLNFLPRCESWSCASYLILSVLNTNHTAVPLTHLPLPHVRPITPRLAGRLQHGAVHPRGQDTAPHSYASNQPSWPWLSWQRRRQDRPIHETRHLILTRSCIVCDEY